MNKCVDCQKPLPQNFRDGKKRNFVKPKRGDVCWGCYIKNGSIHKCKLELTIFGK